PGARRPPRRGRAHPFTSVQLRQRRRPVRRGDRARRRRAARQLPAGVHPRRAHQRRADARAHERRTRPAARLRRRRGGGFMRFGEWALWGFAATVVLTTMMSLSQGLGITRMSVPYLLGSMFSADRDRAKLIGFCIHLINGWLFALVYLFVFHSLHRATWWL